MDYINYSLLNGLGRSAKAEMLFNYSTTNPPESPSSGLSPHDFEPEPAVEVTEDEREEDRWPGH
jgi:hypothetical protein